MARLIIVSGASGAGKTFLLDKLHSLNEKIRILKKLTTRPTRKNEVSNETKDLFLKRSIEEVRSLDYTYHYCGHFYGFNKSDIDNAILQDYSPIVIVASCSTIHKIKKDYKNALVLYVQNILSGEDLKEQLVKERDPIEVNERMARQERSFRDYINHIDKKMFDYVLINNYSEEFASQFEYIFDNEIKINDSNYIFVIMSFLPKYNEIYESFKLAGSLQNSNIVIERVDEQRGDYIITSKIEESIEKSGLLICDISEMSPNVFYEFGYARAKDKEIIVTAKKGVKLPFDVRQYKTIFYDSPISLQKEIVKELNHYFRKNL